MADELTIVKDANGKEFSFNMATIADINGDIGPKASVNTIVDAMNKNRINFVHETKFVDSLGNDINPLQILSDMKSGKTSVQALDVEMEATHSGPNHNYCVYYEDSMEKDCESFVNPFKKPVLKNHNTYDGEPLGRIQQAWKGPSELTDERSAIHLKARITDQDSFAKFLDGRYGTVSISGTMGTVTCNICGRTILKDGKMKFCGHWRGETYKDQVCYWGAKDIEYHEVSTVNNPADDFAQIMKVTVVTNNKDNKEGSDMNGETGAQNTQASNPEEIKKTISDMIDSLLGGVSTSPTPSIQDSETQPTSQAEDDSQQQPAKETSDAELQKKIDQLQKDLDASNQKVADLTKDLEAEKQKVADAEKERDTARAEAISMKDMCLSLATSNKEMVIDNIVSNENASGKLAEDKMAERKTELLAQSMKELNKALEDSKKVQAPRTPVSVPNPTLANNEDSNSHKETEANTIADNKGAKRNVDDFAKDIVSKLFNK